MQVNQKYSDNTSFGKFFKVKGTQSEIKELKGSFQASNKDILALSVKKTKDKAVLYLFTGKTFDKFIDLTKKVFFFDLRRNVEKYMPNRPKKISIKKAKSLLEK